MKCIYKVRHIPSGRFLNGNNSFDALRLTGKPPIGKVWHSYAAAYKHAKFWEVWNDRDIQPGQLEVVEFLLTETSSTQVKQ
jgi:hypothetical protein